MSTRARSNAIAAQTMALSRRLGTAREHYWRALLARPQLAAPIVHAVRLEVETAGWERRLSLLVGLARDAVKTRRREPERRYESACTRAAAWLAAQDRGCQVANGCTDAIAQWAGRRLPDDHGWRVHRLYPARTQSARWRLYWHDVDQSRRERERLRNAIVLANEGLVIQQVNKWVSWAEGHLSREDLQQAGRAGLFRAADLYDPTRGFRFSTYAAGWIRHEVFRLHQKERSDVVWPTAIQQLALALAPAVEREITEPAALAEFLIAQARARAEANARKSGKPVARPRKPPSERAIVQALEYLGIREVSLDARLGRGDDDMRTLQDVLPSGTLTPEEILLRAEEENRHERVAARLLAIVQDLDPRDREIVALRYGLQGQECSAAEAARRLGARRREIDAAESQVLAVLRDRLAGSDAMV